MPRPLSLRTGIALIVFLLLCSLCIEAAPAKELLGRVTVNAGEYRRVDTPVSLSLAGLPLGFSGDTFHLVEVIESKPSFVPTQLEPGSPPRLWWILSGEMKPGTKREYELYAGRIRTRASAIVEKDDKTLRLKLGSRPVLSYNHAIVPPPAGQSELFNRSGFIHPIWSPTGSVLTNIHPGDHYHHVGLWMPWTKTEFEGKAVDFWNLKDGQGTVRFKRFLSEAAGPVFCGFQAEHDHVALQTAAGEKVVLKEVWDVRVYNVGSRDSDYWICDFVSSQRCVADSALHLKKYRYGGFGYRGAAEWEGDTASYLTSEGKTRKNGHTTRARWCDTAGVSDGQWKGVTHFSHPQNLRHPEPMRIWPKGQVFFNWAPVQLDDFDLEPGKDQLFRYRMVLHEGKVDVDRTEQLWNSYAHPPKVTITDVDKKNILFEGSAALGLSRWTGADWPYSDGVMTVGKGNLLTKDTYQNFRMHAEFRVPQMAKDKTGQARGNSGFYIQERYEVQVLDSYGLALQKNGCASLYKFKAPDKNMCRMPGQWQSYDIEFYGAEFDGPRKVKKAKISVWHNGIRVHKDVELPNKTGAGKKEGPEPGPIKLQDHGNPVSFRNIWIEPLD